MKGARRTNRIFGLLAAGVFSSVHDTDEPTPNPTPVGGNGLIVGFLAGFLGAGVLMTAIQAIKIAVRKG